MSAENDGKSLFLSENAGKFMSLASKRKGRGFDSEARGSLK
jgi:hypothetical protein